MNKDVRQLVKKLEKQGATCDYTRGGHLKVSRDGSFVIIPSTPSNHRSLLNARSELRRVGFQIP